jgi:hypothetical protein
MPLYNARAHPWLRLAVMILSICLASRVWADSPSVTAVLSNSEATVGQMVQMDVKVSGANSVQAPEEIIADGLEIRRTGTSRQFEMRNFSTSSSIIYTYSVLPLRPGTFRIPPQRIRIAGAALSTPELTLHVADASARGRAGAGRAAPGWGSQPNVEPGSLAFAELIVPKKTAYVGEMIPAVVRIGLFVRGQLTEFPQIDAQGFTIQKMQTPDQPQPETIDGRRCNVFTFKTALAATRPGKFEIGPGHISAVVIVPRQRQRTSRPRSPFDIFDMDDPFSDPFFANPFGEQQKISIEGQPMTLEVKALPTNAPPNFGGAVGNFSMTVDANPKKVQVGDPITVTAAVSGRGNFGRVTAPALEDEHGWHQYPPSAKFKQDDDVGISGAKTFEAVLSPNEKKQAISPFVFSFFDPAKEQYVTLKSNPIPIAVEGGAPTAVAAGSPAMSLPGPTAAATSGGPAAKATLKPQDILYQLTDVPAHPQSFTPIYATPNFWLIQAIPFVGLIGFVAIRFRQIRLDNREAQRVAALHHEAAELMRRLRRGDASPYQYYLDASRAVQVKTALVKNVEPNVVDVEMAGATFQLDENSRRQLDRLFSRSDELRYSGTDNGGEKLSPENRREVLELMEQLRT